MNDRGERLIAWAFATFHASAFVLVILLLVYRAGGLGQALQGLNTAVGLGLFLALWTTTFIATRQALRGLGLGMPSPVNADRLIGRATRWGALNGVVFLFVLALVIPGGYALTHLGDVFNALRGPTAIQSVLFVIGGLIVASSVALVVGALIGLVFSGIDLVLLGVAARLLPRAHT
jgi:hypothetical protein